MVNIISYLIIFLTSWVLLHLVDRDPTRVTGLEYLMLAILFCTGYVLFRRLLDLYRKLTGLM